jgi:integrase/recombinase XerD
MKLSNIITEYLAYKRALGMKFGVEGRMFSSFCRLVGDVKMNSITTKQIQLFLNGHTPISSFWKRKYTAISGLYRFALSRKYVRTLPLPNYHPQFPPPLVPYIYSHEELKRLLDNTPLACGQNTLIDAFVFRALILILYGACLRHGEALRLTIKDVDLECGVLYIQETKFYKKRIVPLGKDLNKALKKYALKRNKIYCNETKSPFFCSRKNQKLSQSAVWSAFRRLRIQANIQRNDNLIYQPRLHDLRHTGVVHRLIAWYRNGADLNFLLPQLSTYLGHVDLESTKRYLTLTPELLREASLRFEHFAKEK